MGGVESSEAQTEGGDDEEGRQSFPFLQLDSLESLPGLGSREFVDDGPPDVESQELQGFKREGVQSAYKDPDESSSDSEEDEEAQKIVELSDFAKEVFPPCSVA